MVQEDPPEFAFGPVYGRGGKTFSLGFSVKEWLAASANNWGSAKKHLWFYLNDITKSHSTGFPNLYEYNNENGGVSYYAEVHITAYYPDLPPDEKLIDPHGAPGTRTFAVYGNDVGSPGASTSLGVVSTWAFLTTDVLYYRTQKVNQFGIPVDGPNVFIDKYATIMKQQLVITPGEDENGVLQGDMQWTCFIIDSPAYYDDPLRHTGLRMYIGNDGIHPKWRLIGPRFANSPPGCYPAKGHTNHVTPKLLDVGVAPSLRIKTTDGAGRKWDMVEDQNTLEPAQYYDTHGFAQWNAPLKVWDGHTWKIVCRMKPYKQLTATSSLTVKDTYIFFDALGYRYDDYAAHHQGYDYRVGEGPSPGPFPPGT